MSSSPFRRFLGLLAAVALLALAPACSGPSEAPINNGAVGETGVIQFTSATFSALEGATTAVITVTRAGGTLGPLSANFATSDGTAIAGVDYVATAGTFTYGGGEGGTKSFTVTILNDGTAEGPETVNLTLTGMVGGPSAAVLTIFDDDTTFLGVTSTNQLVSFTAANPEVTVLTALTGLQVGETLVGLDFRPATGVLYGLGSTSRLYVVNPATGQAIQVGSGQFATLLNGTAFGFDVNPSADRVRVVSDTGQNLRLNPFTGALAAVDTNLAYAVGDVNAGLTPTVASAAYTNNVADAASTTLFDIDTTLNVLVTQNPPNAGTLNTVGSLGFDTTTQTGFEITSTGSAYASLTAPGGLVSQLFNVNLTTGAVTLVGNIGTGFTVHSITAVRPVAVAQTNVVGLTSDGLSLVRFSTATPGTTTTQAVTGLAADTLVGIDFRPLTGDLYGLGASGNLFAINPRTAAASALPASGLVLTGTEFGFDFNPTVDRIRVTSDADQNVRLNPSTGLIAAVDGALAYAAGDPNFGADPNITGVAYLNNFAGATTTTLFDIDFNLDILTTQNPPNNGTLNTVGALGFNSSGLVGFDITATNNAFASLTAPAAIASTFFTVNTTTGAATLVGVIGGASTLRDLTLAPVTVP